MERKRKKKGTLREKKKGKRLQWYHWITQVGIRMSEIDAQHSWTYQKKNYPHLPFRSPLHKN